MGLKCERRKSHEFKFAIYPSLTKKNKQQQQQEVVLSLMLVPNPLAFVPIMDVHLMHTCEPSAPHNLSKSKGTYFSANRVGAWGSLFTLLLSCYCSSLYTRVVITPCG